jgi:hypothetical protein
MHHGEIERPAMIMKIAPLVLRAEFEVDVYEQSPEPNQVGGDIRGGVP